MNDFIEVYTGKVTFCIQLHIKGGAFAGVGGADCGLFGRVDGVVGEEEGFVGIFE
ncbi:MAG: hypothetical protein LWW97_10185 [Deltaproteobacteria bacterium]|nr:hypothetical protein [Deltaproteobacteria bacterium]